MEDSIAEELYSESLQLSNSEVGSVPIANDDLEDDNGLLLDGSDEDLDRASDLDWEWQTRRDRFHTIGYRDGLMAGKEACAQEGFNIGFKESVVAGFTWGVVRGVTSAIASLPVELKERLIETQEKRNKFQGLYESVHSISTTDALKLFHDNLLTKKAVEQSGHSKDNLNGAGLQESSDCGRLENYVGEIQSLLLESPAIKSHLSVNLCRHD